jgi:hypothetical protein
LRGFGHRAAAVTRHRLSISAEFRCEQSHSEASARATHADLVAGARVSNDGVVGEVTLALGDGSPISGNLETCVATALHKEHFEQAENRNRTLSWTYRMW